MMTIELAGLKIKINNKYNYIAELCKDYTVDTDVYDFEISVTDAEIQAENIENKYTPDYLESLAVYRKIAERLLDYDGFLMHGVVLEIENRGIAFLAQSGVGKTTHTALWKRMLGDKCEIINGDKPLIRFIRGIPYAYGTPWAGKEGFNCNKSVALRNICFLERAADNKIVSCDNALERLMKQIYLPKNNTEKMLKTLELIDKFMRNEKFYTVYCNMNISAAKTVYDELWK